MSPADTPSADLPPRKGADRRRHHLRTFLHCFYKNQRVGMRRRADRGIGHYVDVHGPVVLAVALGIICLSTTDSAFTLLLLGAGAKEVNPVMDALISVDIRLFIIVKFILTAACILFFVAHKHFRLFRFRGQAILTATLVMYTLLIHYELGLLTA